ncbi:DUF6064 family protein [Marinivivus vitaminiproducens]|uniref:DUF6064 family protein n=1 Tax=Marinivivus vitaminiproducens TaxID=3035935 RepID=UPI0027A96328|nr:DUF6064 family protein [Geminicoccaceae bacterium SCSIO 64248]
MGEWSTYSLEDFLLFAPATYERLFVLHNRAVWPMQVPLVALGCLMAGAVCRANAWARTFVFGALGPVWLLVAWSFLAGRYATINWAAVYAAWAFALEAALLVLCAAVLWRAPAETGPGRHRWPGVALIVFALAVQPLLAPLAGRDWGGVELFGTAPDPTAIATLGFVLLLAPPGWRGVLLALPVLWCLATGVTLLAMESPVWGVPPLAALTAVAAATFRPRSG